MPGWNERKEKARSHTSDLWQHDLLLATGCSFHRQRKEEHHQPIHQASHTGRFSFNSKPLRHCQQVGKLPSLRFISLCWLGGPVEGQEENDGLHKSRTLPSAFDVGQPKLQLATDQKHSRMTEWLSMNEKNQKAVQWPVSYPNRRHQLVSWSGPPCLERRSGGSQAEPAFRKRFIRGA